ncbi:MAG: glycosyltransferase family 2 protein [Ruminococcaceae bacterium]|nr:glycosyltransferase family 2 protein [Oscillospiraceae bacterium]
MKTVTFVIPCYNSQDYMEKCIDSLLPGGDDIEILIVNDGSKDRTAEIADRYAAQYPNIVRAVHKENGGHGSGLNVGIEQAQGEYLKVVDSDDWAGAEALAEMMATLRRLIAEKAGVDMMIANYVYEYVEENKQNRICYKNVFPQNKVFGWDEVKKVDHLKYVLMHSVFYRTKLLRESGLKLPEHTFYVDNLFVYVPLPLVKRMYYLNVDFYHYYIGRSDQSVNEKVMVKRLDQQLRVNELLLEAHDVLAYRAKEKMLGKYLIFYLSIMYTVSSTFASIDGSREACAKCNTLWQKLKEKDKKLYRKIRYGSKAFFMWLPGRLGKKISVAFYRLARKVYKFN